MIVVDTGVVSELMRPSPSRVVVGWVRRNERELYTTSITLAEIRYGIERLADGRRKELLRSTAEKQIASICRTHRAALATRNNSEDFRDTGVGVIDPWQPDPHAPTDPDL
jgi:predicted nucleic acid-binding protein